MARKQLGARVSPLVLQDFQEIRRGEGLGLGEALEELMRVANNLGSIHDLKTAAESGKTRIQQKAKLALEAEVNRLKAFYKDDQKDPPEDERTFTWRAGEACKIIEAIIDLVGKTTDAELVKRARSLIVEASGFYGAF